MRLVRNSEDRNPAGTVGGLLGDRSAAYDPTAFGGTTTLVYDEHRRAGQRLRQPQRHDGELFGGIAYRRRFWLTGEETVAGPDAADPAARFAKRHGYLFQTPVHRGPNELAMGVRSSAPAGSRMRRRPWISAPASSMRPRTRLRLRRGFYRYTPDDPDDLTAGGVLEMLAIVGQPQVDLREGRTRGEALRCSG